MENLAVLWTTADRETVMHTVLPYTKEARQNGGFGAVKLVVWGPSARVLAEYDDLAMRVRELMDDGVEVVASRSCADSYGAAAALEDLGIEVVDAGGPLTGMIKDGWKVLAL